MSSLAAAFILSLQRDEYPHAYSDFTVLLLRREIGGLFLSLVAGSGTDKAGRRHQIFMQLPLSGIPWPDIPLVTL